jgi:hypothetical protein
MEITSPIQINIKDILITNHTEEIDSLAKDYGWNNVGFEKDVSGKEIPAYLKLTPETRIPKPFDPDDPGKEICIHILSTSKPDEDKSRNITIDKPNDKYEELKSNIMTKGHITPWNYCQLSNFSVNGGHPWGEGRQAVFIFQTPTVNSNEYSKLSNKGISRVGFNHNIQMRNSAIEIFENEAKELMKGTSGEELVEVSAQKNFDGATDIRKFSYVPPERILGCLEFSDRETFKQFDLLWADLIKTNFDKQSELTESEAIENFVNKANLIVNKENKFMGFIKKIARIPEPAEAHKSCVTTESLLYRYGAMLTRSHELRMFQGLSETLDDQKLLERIVPDKKKYLQDKLDFWQSLKPSFDSTIQIRNKAIELIEASM